ncbi:MAG: (R)-benzylsuccinyl-CoA dehydrogenase [Candidatus Heimdallarchaeota archaeon LC_2]|nr:MAG: (R)-benzylsuccinyl-CoA dehydrogenase [Candidatus Heimdallarchaeota archaeon LC_2]
MVDNHWDWISNEFSITLKKTKAFIETEVIPLESQLVNESFKNIEPQLKELREKVKTMGLWLPQISKKYGGMGLSLMEHGYLSEFLGKSLFGHYVLNCQAPDAGNMEILIDHGTKEQKEQYLMPLLNGETRSCFSMVEPDAPGSNPTWLNTKAEKDGNDYIINGRKWFTSSADGASFAIVMAVTNPDAQKHKRASMIIVPTNTPGFINVENIPVMGSRGSSWSSHSEIKYENCRIPQTNRLGIEGEGFTIAQDRLGPGRIHHCMRWIGIAERAFDLMCTRAVTRHVTETASLASQQTIQNWAAESRVEINASRLMVLDTALKIDKVGAYAARDEISLIKFHVANMLLRVLDRAIQVHGALGVTDYTPLAYWYAHERAARIYDGPDEVHKRSVARRIFAQYKGD